MITNKIGKISGSIVRGTKDAPARLKGMVAEHRFAFREGWNEANPSDKADEPDPWDPWANLPE
jgi:hypothetical protein